MEERVNRPRNLALAVMFVILAAAFSTASDIYIAQNAAGGNTGADCADAHAASWFNSAANWGSNAAQVGPGTTVHLCGTFTGSAGATMLNVQGSGSSGNPVIIQFESGAALNAPYWSANGAITCSNQNYITIDGNNSGIIANTNNGTNLTYQNPSKGVYFSNCSNAEVKNLTVQNLYQRVNDTSSNGSQTYGVYFDAGCDHIKADGNTIFMSRNLIFVAYSSVTSAQIYNNTLDHSSWMIVMGDDNSGSSASGVLIYGNTLGPHFNEWLDTAQTMHADGIMIFAANSGSSATAQIYDNYITCDMCSTPVVNCSGYIYTQGNSRTSIFNNVIYHTTSASNGPEAEIIIRGNSPGPAPSNMSVYNNTLVGQTSNTVGVKDGGGQAGTGLVVENNIFLNLSVAMTFGPNSLSSLSTSGPNDFFGNNSIAADNVDSGPENAFTTLADWQGQGFDKNRSSGNPSLANYMPQSGSAAIGIGANLTALAITALDSDMAGVVRPTSGAWAAGAYQDPTSGSAPAPPTGLAAAVQ
jgi:hypothetical protein